MMYVMSYKLFESKINKKEEVVNTLKNNYCEFNYTKKSGEKRHAFGTLKDDFLKSVWTPSPNSVPKKNLLYVVYWDLKRKNFRQFNINNFSGFKNYFEYIDDFVKEYPKIEKYIKSTKRKKIHKKDEKKEEE